MTHRPEPTHDHDGGAEPALGDALTGRLDQLREPTWMHPVLEQAIGRLTGERVEIDEYAIDYCKIKPRRDINVALEVSYHRAGIEGLLSRRFSCTVFPTAERGRAKFADETARATPEATRRTLAEAGFEQTEVLLDDPALILRVFPVDPVLPGLAGATGGTRLRELLGARLGEAGHAADGGEPGRIDWHILHYKPLRTCTLRYDVEVRGNGSGPRTWHAYGKMYRDERGDRCYELLTAAWDAARASGGTWQAAEPLGQVPEWKFMLQASVPGRQFRHLFAELTHDHASEAELTAVRGHLRSIATAVRSMQTSGVRLGPTNDFAALLASQERNLAHLHRSQPELASEIAAVRERLVEVEPLSPASPPGFAHGDFAHGNVLIDDAGRVGLIDFDRGCLAEPAYDVAYFLTHMWSFGVRHPKRHGHVAPLCDDFRDAWLASAPDVSPQRLALYEALDFAAYVLRNFRKQSHQSSWLGWAGKQIEAAWDRLEVAAGAKGAGP